MGFAPCFLCSRIKQEISNQQSEMESIGTEFEPGYVINEDGGLSIPQPVDWSKEGYAKRLDVLSRWSKTPLAKELFTAYILKCRIDEEHFYNNATVEQISERNELREH